MALTSVEQAIVQQIRGARDPMEARLAEMVAIPTGHEFGPGLDAMRSLLSQRLRSLGAEVEELAADTRPKWITPNDRGEMGSPTVVARRLQGRSGPTLLLAGHMDTVHDPAGDFQKLQRLSPSRATGPGAADMKGGLEVALTALEALEKHAPGIRWIFIVNADEEAGSFRSARHLAQIAKECDAGFILEPALSDGGLVVERPGSGQFMIDVVGRAAHSGRDFASGVSAVNALAAAILEASRMTDLSRRRIVNIGPLQGGEATNIVADHARAWGNIRFADAAEGEELGSRLEGLVSGDVQKLPCVTIHKALNRPAKPLTPEVSRLAAVAQGAGRDLGLALSTGSTGGVSDGNLIQAAGVPCLDGLGVRGGHLHRSDEFIELDSLTERAALLAILLSRVAKDESGAFARKPR
ncbi:MAG: M20/M25/M40 family metallo-hydrolase [Planctomycetes bacterium]|nr:M20/M25/M40 family metallo-hydrolase [Planctomycetota bacterium]